MYLIYEYLIKPPEYLITNVQTRDDSQKET